MSLMLFINSLIFVKITLCIALLVTIRMHSSRMCTGRSLTICLGGLLPRGVCSQGGSAPGGVCFRGMVTQHALRQTPPLNRMTDRCKNITLVTTSLRPVIMMKSHFRPFSFAKNKNPKSNNQRYADRTYNLLIHFTLRCF